ncbi:MAG TPA: RtcB family protein [Polyangiaceae bacterium]|jgi:tRNA-splicing ligase RtcB|nr:RtcB family protein [Polyangiaceae bacterium]
MPSSLIQGETVPIRSWAPPDSIEPAALAQLKALASLPWVVHHVAVMPDVHLGKGATVGSVIAMKDAVAPAAVGVDIGCGMSAVRTTLLAKNLPDSLRSLRNAIEARIPVGRASHDESIWTHAEPATRSGVVGLLARFDTLAEPVQRLSPRAEAQLGTLGGGNHFIELCLDTDDRLWILLHSGSRHIGAALAEHHMEAARRAFHGAELPDPELAVFFAGTPPFEAYRRDLSWAQDYARLNRELMVARVQGVLRERWRQVAFEATISCHHNYLAEECHFGEDVLVTRKGAIRAGAGELGIIPGSMGSRSYVVRGKGNPLSFESASHGAGRRMSRTQARRTFTVRDLEQQTDGVECRKDRGVLDELPTAYKDIDRVMAEQADLVEVVATLKQVLCVKG